MSPGLAAEAPATPGGGLALRSAAGRVALTATVAASGMASLDATVVNVALPHIGDDLHAGVSGLQWVLTGYLLALASLILLGGALGDRYGRRKIFLIGTIWFAAASALCAAAPNIEVLVGARVLAGVGAALLTPGSLAILQASFRPGDRSRAVGAWSGLSGVAGAAGPFIGGWLVDGPGWRWVFLLNVPVGLLVVVCSVIAVPETRDSQVTGHLDLLGAAIAVVSLGAATWALTEAGPRGWSSPTRRGGGGSRPHRGRSFRIPHDPRPGPSRAAETVQQSRFHGDESGDRGVVLGDRSELLPGGLSIAGGSGLVGLSLRDITPAGDGDHAVGFGEIWRYRPADRPRGCS